MYDYVHGYGNNVTGNGYLETDGNRNSLFNTEAPRNDAMLFGEYDTFGARRWAMIFMIISIRACAC